MASTGDTPQAADPPAPGCPMKISAVRLFTNGMAHVEAVATVDGDATLSLPVRSDTMSDVLKSLSVADTSGRGTIASITYDSPPGGGRGTGGGGGGGGNDLAVPPAEALVRLLVGAQGAGVALTLVGDGGAVAGKLLGTQSTAPLADLPVASAAAAAAAAAAGGSWRPVTPVDVGAVRGDAAPPPPVAAVVLSAAGEVVAVPLADVAAVRLTDGALAGAVGDALDRRGAALHASRQTVRVRCAGAGRRHVVARWAVEAPVWKTTYRLYTGGDDGRGAAGGAGGGDPGASPPAPKGDGGRGGASAAPGAAGAPAPPPPPLVIQGWAIVDNGFEVFDLEAVRLTLLSGAGVSFRTSLYEHRYKARVDEPTGDDTPATGRVSAGNALFAGAPGPPAAAASAFGGAPAPKGASRGGIRRYRRIVDSPEAAAASRVGGGGGGMRGGAAADDDSADEEADGGFGGAPPAVGGSADGAAAVGTAAASGAAVGDNYAYTVAAPVSVRRRESAMVPILASPIDGGRVGLYRPSIRGANPLSAIRLTNTSGSTLPGGPVSVLHGETLAGEAMLRACRPGDVQLLPYAVDLDVDADVGAAPAVGWVRRPGVAGGGGADAAAPHAHVHELTMARGVLTATSYRERHTAYTFTSRRSAELRLYVDHPKATDGFRFHGAAVAAGRPPADAPSADGGDAASAGGVTPAEEDATAVRLHIVLPPPPAGGGRSLTTLTVSERAARRVRHALVDLSDDAVGAYVSAPAVSPHGAATLRSLAALRRQLSDAGAAVSALNADAAEEAATQERLRANLGALAAAAAAAPSASPAEAALRGVYVDGLAASEAAVGRLRAERRVRGAALADARRALDEAVAAARF